MVSYFPPPYRDELLYSIVARYKEHTNVSCTKAMDQLFNAEKFGLNFYLGKSITALAKKIASLSNIDEDELIQQHTIYPFIAAFSPKVERKNIYDSMLSSKSKMSFRKFDGLNAASFKYCPECVKEDRELVGETFWRRRHNIPYVKTCTQHKCNLEEARVDDGEKSHILTAESTISNDYTSSYDPFSKNLDIQCIQILQGDPIDLQFIVAKFFANGMVKSSGSRNTIKPGATTEIGDFVYKNYQYLNHLCPMLGDQLHQIVNGRWKGFYPMVMLLLEEFLQSTTEIDARGRETHPFEK